ncbi:MAG: hypothetical protein AB1466_01550 [Actinomycetota bacterium]
MRTFIEEKAQRLLNEKNIELLESGPGKRRKFRIKGDNDSYLIFLWSDNTHYCNCPARIEECSHIKAAKMYRPPIIFRLKILVKRIWRRR